MLTSDGHLSLKPQDRHLAPLILAEVVSIRRWPPWGKLKSTLITHKPSRYSFILSSALSVRVTVAYGSKYYICRLDPASLNREYTKERLYVKVSCREF